MDVPQTVTAALEDRAVDGATCLEAGAGVGSASSSVTQSPLFVDAHPSWVATVR